MFGLKKIRRRLDELEVQRVAGHLMDVVTALADSLGYRAYYSLGEIEIVEPKGSLQKRVEGLEEQVKRLAHLQSGEAHRCGTCGVEVVGKKS